MLFIYYLVNDLLVMLRHFFNIYFLFNKKYKFKIVSITINIIGEGFKVIKVFLNLFDSKQTVCMCVFLFFSIIQRTKKFPI